MISDALRSVLARVSAADGERSGQDGRPATRVEDAPDHDLLAGLRIGLLGPYGFGNLGDAAIQDSAIHQVRRLQPNARIMGLSGNPEDTERRHGVCAVPNSAAAAGLLLPATLRRFLAWRSRNLAVRLVQRAVAIAASIAVESVFLVRTLPTISKLDVLVISGGGQIDDYWGGPWGHPYTLFSFAVLARCCRIRVVVLGIGGWKLESRLSRLFIEAALRCTEFRSFRDTRTRDFVRSLGVPEPNIAGPDLAFGYPMAGRSRGPRPRRGVFAVSPISAKAWTSESDPVYRRYVNILVELVQDLLGERQEVRLVLSQVRMDRPVVAEVAQRLKDRGEGGAVVVPIESVEEFLDAIEAVDVVIASRLHGVLLSLAMTRPVLALSYDAKVNVLMEDLGLERYCLDLKSLELSAARERVGDLARYSADIAAELLTRTDSYRSIIEEQFRTVFPPLGSRAV